MPASSAGQRISGEFGHGFELLAAISGLRRLTVDDADEIAKCMVQQYGSDGTLLAAVGAAIDFELLPLDCTEPASPFRNAISVGDRLVTLAVQTYSHRFVDEVFGELINQVSKPDRGLATPAGVYVFANSARSQTEP